MKSKRQVVLHVFTVWPQNSVKNTLKQQKYSIGWGKTFSKKSLLLMILFIFLNYVAPTVTLICSFLLKFTGHLDVWESNYFQSYNNDMQVRDSSLRNSENKTLPKSFSRCLGVQTISFSPLASVRMLPDRTQLFRNTMESVQVGRLHYRRHPGSIVYRRMSEHLGKFSGRFRL